MARIYLFVGLLLSIALLNGCKQRQAIDKEAFLSFVEAVYSFVAAKERDVITRAFGRFPSSVAVCIVGTVTQDRQDILDKFWKLISESTRIEVKLTQVDDLQKCSKNVYLVLRLFAEPEIQNPTNTVWQSVSSRDLNYIASDLVPFKRAVVVLGRFGFGSGLVGSEAVLAPRRFWYVFVNDYECPACTDGLQMFKVTLLTELTQALLFAPDLPITSEPFSLIHERYPPNVETAVRHSLDEVRKHFQLYVKNLCLADMLLIHTLYLNEEAEDIEETQDVLTSDQFLDRITLHYDEIYRSAQTTMRNPEYATLFENPC
jgi:hypothetical protein